MGRKRSASIIVKEQNLKIKGKSTSSEKSKKQKAAENQKITAIKSNCKIPPSIDDKLKKTKTQDKPSKSNDKSNASLTKEKYSKKKNTQRVPR